MVAARWGDAGPPGALGRRAAHPPRDLILELVDSEQHSLQEISADPAIVGRALSSVRTERSGLVLGLVHQGRVIMGIGEDPVIADGTTFWSPSPATAAASRPPDRPPS